MAKANDFETATYSYNTARQRFSEDANVHYRYTSAEELINNKEDLQEMIQHHQEKQVKRLKTLKNYYLGNNEAILQANRRKEDDKADHRATLNYAKYVSQFIQGYLVGIPIKMTYNDEEEGNTSDYLKEINRDNEADVYNSDLVFDLSIFGRAYELLFRSNDYVIMFTNVDVETAFCIYDVTMDMNQIAAVLYVRNKFTHNKYNVTLYTTQQEIKYETKDANLYELKEIERKPHAFDGVPIIEYQNNKYRQGDFENVLNLIDLYDSAQSDIANYMTDFNDAMLYIAGRLGLESIDDNPINAVKKMKDANILYIEPPEYGDREGRADAGYLYKQYDVNGTEAYKTRVENDIHKFTNTPNLNDEKFSGTQSGESMKYKLFGLEQVRATKERLFKKSLRNRYRLINNISTIAREGSFDANDITITFTPNLPKSLQEEIDNFNALGGQLSQETILSTLSIVENPQEEIEKLRNENPTERQRQQMYNDATWNQDSEEVMENG
ncbi:phage portal protein [Paraliobacillus ryukyuensis]|uniref:phage portal protein n=1 Tax=Paraliobacillus ryukyuensis TaxID=200904 RepID=UPI0009A65871|nr:phage portal protein [Paraliobacillus ryukyuensis]